MICSVLSIRTFFGLGSSESVSTRKVIRLGLPKLNLKMVGASCISVEPRPIFIQSSCKSKNTRNNTK